MDRKSAVALLVARVGLGIIFLMSGLGKVAAWGGTVAHASARGVPEILLAGAVALEIAGGASVILGWKTRFGVAALLAFLAPVTLVFHGFWSVAGPEVRIEMIQFLKNLAIAGGLLALGAAGPGALSVDARAARRLAAASAPAAPLQAA